MSIIKIKRAFKLVISNKINYYESSTINFIVCYDFFYKIVCFILFRSEFLIKIEFFSNGYILLIINNEKVSLY